MPVCWVVFSDVLPFTPFYSVTVVTVISKKLRGKKKKNNRILVVKLQLQAILILSAEIERSILVKILCQ